MRRRSGTGTIDKVKRADGATEFYPRLPSGKRLDPVPSPEAADVALAEALHQIAEHRLLPVDGMRFGAWGRRCIEGRARDGYRNASRELSRWTTHVEQTPLGAMAVTQVRPADIIEWLRSRSRADAKAGNGHKTHRRRKVSRSTVIDAFRLVRMAFKEAILEEMRSDNPTLGIPLPRDHGRSHDPWTWLRVAEVHALLAVDGIPAEDRDAALVALYTGLRQGELWTLHLRDVDPVAGLLAVRYGGRKGKKLLPPKNGRPRTLPLLPAALAALTRQMTRLKAAKRRNPHGLVFPSVAHGGTYRAEGHPPPCWHEWIPRAKLTAADRGDPVRVTWHTLRHTFATLVLAGALPGCEGEGWRLERVSAYLGHSDFKVTQRYADTAALLLPNEVPTARGAHAMQPAGSTAAIPGRVELPTNGLGNRWFSLENQEHGGTVGARMDLLPTPLGAMSAEQVEGLADVLEAVLARRGSRTA